MHRFGNMRNYKINIILVLFIAFFASCSTHEKIVKSNDITYKLTKANEYYDQEKWHKANDVYERLMPVFRGTPDYEQVFYRYCYTFYNMKNYLVASYQFKNFVEHFPRSAHVQEMQFMAAKSMFLDAPDYKLDQESTKNAIVSLVQFTMIFPDSKYITEANNLINEGKEKVKQKDEYAAQLYYDMGRFKNAVTAFEVLTMEYPDASNVDYFYYMMLKSQYEYAKGSLEKRQIERYQSVIDTAKELKDYFPRSKYLSESLTLSKYAQNKIKQLSK